MTFGPLSRRLGARALVALLALVAVVWLNVAPHRHPDDWSERHCAACQVVRGDGQEAPALSSALPPPSAGATRIAAVLPSPVATTCHGGPPPARSPPFILS